MNKVRKRQSSNADVKPFALSLACVHFMPVHVELLRFMDILGTRDTYRLALKGSLKLSPLVLPCYRFILTALPQP